MDSWLLGFCDVVFVVAVYRRDTRIYCTALIVSDASCHCLRDTRLLPPASADAGTMVADMRMGSPNSLPYDPDQDAAEKRDIRKRYRALEKRTGGL